MSRLYTVYSVSQLVDTVVGYFCITFLYFLYSFFCNLQCTLFVTNPADWLPYNKIIIIIKILLQVSGVADEPARRNRAVDRD